MGSDGADDDDDDDYGNECFPPDCRPCRSKWQTYTAHYDRPRELASIEEFQVGGSNRNYDVASFWMSRFERKGSLGRSAYVFDIINQRRQQHGVADEGTSYGLTDNQVANIMRGNLAVTDVPGYNFGGH